MQNNLPTNKPDLRSLHLGMAASGIALGLIFLIALLVLRAQLLSKAQSFLISAQNSIATTRISLEILGEGLETSRNGLADTRDSLNILGKSVQELPRLTENIGKVIDEDLSQFAADGQSALLSASESSRLIDNTLRVLASIPLIGADYRPEVPLETSLGDLAASFGEMPLALAKMRTDLETSASSLRGLETSIGDLTAELDLLAQELQAMQPQLEAYGTHFKAYDEQVRGLQASLPRWVNLATLALALLLLWFIFNQILRFLVAWAEPNSGKIPKENPDGLTTPAGKKSH